MAVLVLALFVGLLAFPHIVGAGRGVKIGRSAIKSHRHSVRAGARMGRWQAVAIGLFVITIINQVK